MNVHLRERKQTKKGKISLYLEFYKGTIKTDDGKVKADREYEYLDLYLIDKPKTQTEKESNKQTLDLAESIRAKRLLEIKNGEYGFKRAEVSKANFIVFFRQLTDKKEPNEGNFGNWDSTYKHLLKYAGKKVSFSKIDKSFCEGFLEHLQNVRKSDNKPLSSASISSYYSKFRASLNKAVKNRYLSFNPASEIETPRVDTAKRDYLTIEELKAVSKEECRYPVLKNAFLFACLTGLRWSDVKNLTWSKVEQSDKGWRIVFHQKKTKGLQYLDIPNNAIKYLGEPKSPDERPFKGLNYSTYMNVALQRWMMEAGITKNITFHCARHTFAVIQLSLGTDIYTLSKLLGHKNLKTTQIYADIIDQKRKEASNRLNEIEI